MIDIYSLGNIFYSLLTESWPFENLKEDEAQNRISEGKRPNLEFDVMKNSTDRVSIVMKEAIRICWAQEPTTRPSAMELVHFLQSELNNIIESP
jgi:serine/threonine protein kinase